MSVLRASLFRLATSTRFERVVRAAPLGEQRAWRAASRYVAGTTVEQAWEVTARLSSAGVDVSVETSAGGTTARRTAGGHPRSGRAGYPGTRVRPLRPQLVPILDATRSGVPRHGRSAGDHPTRHRLADRYDTGIPLALSGLARRHLHLLQILWRLAGHCAPFTPTSTAP